MSAYDLRYSQVFDDLQKKFEQQAEVTEDMVLSGSDLSNPQSPGQAETITLSLSGLGRCILIVQSKMINGICNIWIFLME